LNYAAALSPSKLRGRSVNREMPESSNGAGSLTDKDFVETDD
jgi:hypothetical protein